MVTSKPGPEEALATTKTQPHHGSVTNKLNWLRAALLGANDGIVSTAGIVVGVAAATAERGPVLTVGIAGPAAGALSMAVGEYPSVSTQRDTERALLDTECQELKLQPDAELEELTALHGARGLSPQTARQATVELTAYDPLAAHAEPGWVAARLGGAKPLRPVQRVIAGGALAMAITFAIGHLVGASIG